MTLTNHCKFEFLFKKNYFISIVINFYIRRIDIQTNGTDETENEPVSDGRSNKRPVSMFEPREGPYMKVQQIPESRTTNSMYQMAIQKHLDPTLPLSEEVKHRTDVVTRRIQELWSAMQDATLKDAFVPCSERIRVAVAELAAIFPNVNFEFTDKTSVIITLLHIVHRLSLMKQLKRLSNN